MLAIINYERLAVKNAQDIFYSRLILSVRANPCKTAIYQMSAFGSNANS